MKMLPGSPILDVVNGKIFSCHEMKRYGFISLLCCRYWSSTALFPFKSATILQVFGTNAYIPHLYQNTLYQDRESVEWLPCNKDLAVDILTYQRDSLSLHLRIQWEDKPGFTGASMVPI
jgi:hypothetical protein